MSRFANLADAGQRLSVTLADELDRDQSVLLAVIPNGVPVAVEVADALGVPVRGLSVERSETGVTIPAIEEQLSGIDLAVTTLVVIDDGVETGTVARAVAPRLRSAGARTIVLAVPVCPREAMADLALRYDRVVAVQTPMVRRALSWQFEDFDTIDEARAAQLLAGRS